MSEGQRIPLATAERLAAEVQALLQPACRRIEVAGSVRRKKADVGDVELVCIPKESEQRGQLDLFGNALPQPPAYETDALVVDLLARGILGGRRDKNGRLAIGTRYKRLAYEPAGRAIALDLFCVVSPAQFGVLFAIRTGCAEFSHKLVTPRLLGGWLPTGLRVRDGALWDGERLIETPDEGAFFDAAGVQWLLPELRTPNRRPVLLQPPSRSMAATKVRA